MRVHVDLDLCIGCGICEGDAPTFSALPQAPWQR
jgi:ferredoxin